MLGLVTGGVMAFMALLILSLMLLCLMNKNTVKTFGEEPQERSDGSTTHVTHLLVSCLPDEPMEVLMTKKR